MHSPGVYARVISVCGGARVRMRASIYRVGRAEWAGLSVSRRRCASAWAYALRLCSRVRAGKRAKWMDGRTGGKLDEGSQWNSGWVWEGEIPTSRNI